MSTGRFFDRTIPFLGFHGSSEVLQTLLVAPPSWIQDGGAGNDVNQDLGRPFRSPLWRWRKMAALPLPAAILDDLIPGPGNWEWGHPRWRPEAEGPPSCATATMGIEKAALYYWCCILTDLTQLSMAIDSCGERELVRGLWKINRKVHTIYVINDKWKCNLRIKLDILHAEDMQAPTDLYIQHSVRKNIWWRYNSIDAV